MSAISNLLDALNSLVLEDEDGNDLLVHTRPGVCERDLQDWEHNNTVHLPAELRDLLTVSNGIGFFGLEIVSVGSLQYFPQAGIIAFHNWGNGDFDCVAASPSAYSEGTVLFMNHSPDVVVPIAASLHEWIERIVGELRTRGAVLHPADYRLSTTTGGVYRLVTGELAGRECELNSDC